ncbi:MAG: endonuclease/exonuclease/phosphatase family protein [Salibacteraceae bacterium]
MYKLLITLLFTSSFFVSHSQALRQLSFGTDSTLDIATWNIEHFPKQGQTTVDSAAAIIKALNIDVWGLQEIDDITELNKLVAKLPNYKVATGTGTQRGLAYVYNEQSVLRPKIYRIYESSAYSSPFPRRPLVFEFQYKGEIYYVINNHFKCCGDGTLNQSNSGDEEMRRLLASKLLKQWVDSLHSNDNVVVLGDLNDILTDAPANNVFQNYLNDTANYWVSDLSIEQGASTNWSYPSWPSHLDHLIVTDEIQDKMITPGSDVACIRPDDYLNRGWSDYDYKISDHRPVAIKIDFYKTPKDTIVDSNKVSVFGLYKSENSPTVYPNPFKNEIRITLERNSTSNYDVMIFDLKGKELEQPKIQNLGTELLIETNYLDKGNYIIVVNKNGNFYHQQTINKL